MNTITVETHPALVQAYKEYMEALQMKRSGLIANTYFQRQRLLAVYRFLTQGV